MPTTTRSFSVSAPPAAVIDYLKDFSNAVEWDPGTESCVRQDSGPVVVGSTWLNTSKIAGITTELTYTLENVTDQQITLVGKNKTATSTDTITVTPNGSGSDITYEAHIALHGAANLGAPLVKLVFEKVGNDTEDQMVEVLGRLGSQSS